MTSHKYKLLHEEKIITPALVYYKDLVEKNIQIAISMADGPERLWPHVKTHKSADMVKLMLSYGITRFKAATIAEAEMAASCGAAHVLLSYPLVGPNPGRFVALEKAFPNVTFWAIGDDLPSVEALSRASAAAGVTTAFLVDVNMDMDRTGVPIKDCVAFFEQCTALAGISVGGFHCYDGNHNEGDVTLRRQQVAETAGPLAAVRAQLEARGCEPIFVMGGTPSFPCYVGDSKAFVSPGTCFLNDASYGMKYTDMSFENAAIVLTRVVSHPAPGKFTLDLGYKGIAADPQGPRGVIYGHEKDFNILMQNEEHWVFEAVDERISVPPIGTMLYVIPTHICPTSALYPSALVARNGEIIGEWEITARNRKITY